MFGKSGKGGRRGAWRWGDYPPQWVLLEISKALRLMGTNNETVHTMDMGSGFSFVIAIADTASVERMRKVITEAIGGLEVLSEQFYPDKPRAAVHGDIYQ